MSTFSTAPDLPGTIVETLAQPPFSVNSLVTLKAAVDDAELLGGMVVACAVAMGAVLDNDAEQPQADIIAVRLRRARLRAALIAAASQKEVVVKAKFSVDAILVSAAQLFGCLPNNELVPLPHVAEVLSRDRYLLIEFKTYPEITAAASKSVIQFTLDGQAVETAKLPTGKPPNTFEQ
ncbi:hypothetical protein Pmar_PMAR015873 [Perkinsus marinus ATCC 50983]|uniref:Uncharacterized protein n=1 Tax=Perkinsus marinus (strain ATCC 50983 / TXsc) TaxID=423536 RepID=C5K8C6_PERM5|nr:hypothetical protein Pmar_PMAR015873 [Perkinsus marinus ATCC 50983]EER19314.1 hypothetical protein Pmar_PMAR015873 [Perkinsus marinus ATCC 50983]|eukprot:XP_002787518.1 hypothetical protein Pmar_PMAR015873 [Perkinsus marinus ATCC 50983]